eukprot:2711439-Rhodomonas_salina.1
MPGYSGVLVTTRTSSGSSRSSIFSMCAHAGSRGTGCPGTTPVHEYPSLSPHSSTGRPLGAYLGTRGTSRYIGKIAGGGGSPGMHTGRYPGMHTHVP